MPPGPRIALKPGAVEAIDFHFDPSTIPAWPSQAKWIWHPGESDSAPAALFRKVIDLAETPMQVEAWISADVGYRLYVNGQLVDRGPDDVGKDFDDISTGKWMLNYRDLTPYFKAGRNVIAAEVFRTEALFAHLTTSGQSGLLFEARLEFPDGKSLAILSDDSWRGIEAPHWSQVDWQPPSGKRKINALCFDANREPRNWQREEFSDDAWPFCGQVKDVWSPAIVSQLPPRMEAVYPHQTIVRHAGEIPAQSLAFSKPGEVIWKFDRVLPGYIRLRVRGEVGASLEIQPEEIEGIGFFRMLIIRLRDGEQEIETPFFASFSQIKICVRDVKKRVEIIDVQARFISAPVSYRGSFSCSDPALNRIWDSTRWLTQICLQTHHLDSPEHQEPIACAGDYLIEALSTYYAFGYPWLARQDLRKCAWVYRRRDFAPFHLSYAPLWLQMLLDYGDYTGDTELWRELSPEVFDLIEKFNSFRGANGLLTNAPTYMFMDWVKISHFEGHHPPAVIGQGYLTAFFYRALADGIRIADFVGDAARIERYTRLREEIYQAYQTVLWDEKAGLYRDGVPFQSNVTPHRWLPADEAIETHTAQNNLLAVLYDLAPAEAQSEILKRVLAGPDFNCQPYFLHFGIDALFHCGLFNTEALPQIRRWAIHPITQTFREMWEDGDYSHAWQTPLFQLSARVLGVTPLAPGFTKVKIHPHPGDLQWAKGEVPTPLGPVRVEWKIENGRLQLDYSIPPGMEAVIVNDSLVSI